MHIRNKSALSIGVPLNHCHVSYSAQQQRCFVAELVYLLLLLVTYTKSLDCQCLKDPAYHACSY
jgi:hypothetical protein